MNVQHDSNQFLDLDAMLYQITVWISEPGVLDHFRHQCRVFDQGVLQAEEKESRWSRLCDRASCFRRVSGFHEVARARGAQAAPLGMTWLPIWMNESVLVPVGILHLRPPDSPLVLLELPGAQPHPVIEHMSSKKQLGPSVTDLSVSADYCLLALIYDRAASPRTPKIAEAIWSEDGTWAQSYSDAWWEARTDSRVLRELNQCFTRVRKTLEKIEPNLHVETEGQEPEGETETESKNNTKSTPAGMGDAVQAAPLPNGDLSVPMSKKQIKAAIGIEQDRSFEAWAEGKLYKINRQTFQVILDKCAPNERAKFEQA